ncbi:MAG: hypothetical protein ABSH08_17135 [Tepidisphaeraceae bacterium]
MARPLFKILGTLAILFVVLLCFLLWEGGAYMAFLPKYHEANLLGLSKKEVIDRLGEPFFDPSKAFPYRGEAPASWAGAKPEWPMEINGVPQPLMILYESPIFDCRIEFQNDRVVKAELIPSH